MLGFSLWFSISMAGTRRSLPRRNLRLLTCRFLSKAAVLSNKSSKVWLARGCRPRTACCQALLPQQHLVQRKAGRAVMVTFNPATRQRIAARSAQWPLPMLSCASAHLRKSPLVLAPSICTAPPQQLVSVELTAPAHDQVSRQCVADLMGSLLGFLYYSTGMV